MNKKSILNALFLPIFQLVLINSAFAADVEPTMPKPYAPLDIKKSKEIVQKPTVAERKEVLSEFGGILYMGLNKASYEKWSGKEMSDCLPGNGADKWCQRCEMITPHANAFYAFYKDTSRNTCTLQEITVHINVADQSLLKDLKKPIRSIFGPEIRTTASATSYQWNADGENAQLFMQAPQGYDPSTIKFEWLRTPLSRSKSLQGTAMTPTGDSIEIASNQSAN